MQQDLNHLRELGQSGELIAAAERRAMWDRNARPAHNAHLHLPPNFSAFTTAAQAMAIADAQQCRVVGASNYYDYHVYGEFAREARRHNVLPLFGLEIICMNADLRDAGIKINDPGNPGKMYVCGKGITRFADLPAEAGTILNTFRQTDAKRIDDMVARLSAILAERGLPNDMTTRAVVDMVVRRHGAPRETICLQERHVAQAFQEWIFARVPAAERIHILTRVFGTAPRIKSPDDAVGVQNEFRAHLMKAGKPGYVNEAFIDFVSAMRLIRALGGFASYPILGDSTAPVCPFEDPPEAFTKRLQDRGFFAAEFISNRNSRVFMERYTRVLRGAGIIVMAGTEHNTLDPIPLAPVCLGSEPIPPELADVFYEGTCVIAAHQFLVAQGQVGYVDAGGNLNGSFRDAEERIRWFACLGEEVIERYLKMPASK